MPKGSPDGSHITFTDAEVAEFNEIAARSEIAQLNELIVRYARKKGGLTLAVWECLDGPRFGLNVKWRPYDVGAHLGIPHSKVDEIHDATLAAVRPIWEQTEEARRFHERRGGGLASG